MTTTNLSTVLSLIRKNISHERKGDCNSPCYDDCPACALDRFKIQLEECLKAEQFEWQAAIESVDPNEQIAFTGDKKAFVWAVMAKWMERAERESRLAVELRRKLDESRPVNARVREALERAAHVAETLKFPFSFINPEHGMTSVAERGATGNEIASAIRKLAPAPSEGTGAGSNG